nr:hypothetical protein [uncultured Dysosmobacter sp.]
MIVTAAISAIWAIVEPLVNRMPDIAINYDSIASSSVFTYIKAGLYFLPMHTVWNIFSLIVALWVLRIIIAVLHTLWASLPIV